MNTYFKQYIIKKQEVKKILVNSKYLAYNNGIDGLEI